MRTGRTALVVVGAVAVAIAIAGCSKEDKAEPSTVPAAPPRVQQEAKSDDGDTATKLAEAPEEPEEIAAQHIVVAWRGAKNAPRDILRTKEQARERAEEVLKKARAKEKPFEELAMEYSDDDSKLNRASLGKFNKEKMVPAFSGPAFKLKVNEISDIVETEFGFHIIKRNQ